MKKKRQQNNEENRKEGEYLITYTRHLEKRLRNLETEKQLLKAEVLRLGQELRSLKKGDDRNRNTNIRNKQDINSETSELHEDIKGIKKKIQGPNEKLLRWYELLNIKTNQPLDNNNIIEDESNDTNDLAFKIIVLGKPEKTAFIRMFATGVFAEDIKMTIGADFTIRNVEIEGKKITLRIWDFATEERFKRLFSLFIKGSNGAIIMYDVINTNTIITITELLKIMKENVGYIPIFLNVPELPFKAKEIVALAKEYTITEITTEVGPNGEYAFEKLTKKMLEYENI
ncbi:MAG: hypothetical protein ACFFAI_08650 [Promethearchaeota archaeon]